METRRSTPCCGTLGWNGPSHDDASVLEHFQAQNVLVAFDTNVHVCAAGFQQSVLHVVLHVLVETAQQQGWSVMSVASTKAAPCAHVPRVSGVLMQLHFT